MDEFGRPAEDLQESEEVEQSANTPTAVHKDDKALVRIQRSPSPVPFSQYAPENIGMMNSAPPQPPPEENHNGAGCCRCVIM